MAGDERSLLLAFGFCPFCFGHLHSCLAHKSCLMAERTGSASILALFHMVPSISTWQHNHVSPPVQSRTGLKRGESHAQSYKVHLWQKLSQSLNATLRRRGHLLPPRRLIVFKDFSVNDNRALAVFKFEPFIEILLFING